MLGWCLVLGLGALPGHAAPIRWGVHDITNDEGNVSTRGRLVDARNGNEEHDVTVNGVTFRSSANGGNLFDSLFRNDKIRDRAYGTVVGDGKYRQFLTVGQRSGRIGVSDGEMTPPTQDWATVQFTGLTVGHTYEVQIWASDVGSSANGTSQEAALVLGDGQGGAVVQGVDAQLLYEETDFGSGQYGIGTFTANAPNQAFNLQRFNGLPGSPNGQTNGHFCNGWQIRDLGVGAAGPEIAVDQGGDIGNGGSRDFGSVTVGSSQSLVFTISNSGFADLNLSGLPLVVSGDAEFTITAQPSTPVALGGGTTDFTVQFAPTSAVAFSASISIASDDSDENPFVILLTGTGNAPDTTAPDPDPASFAVAPAADGPYSISMTATTASDPSGVEYYFAETSGNPGGDDSGWQDSPSYTDTGLDPDTQTKHQDLVPTDGNHSN